MQHKKLLFTFVDLLMSNLTRIQNKFPLLVGLFFKLILVIAAVD